MESKELTIVIVTFKSDEKIINCLKSISNNTPVIVVENSDNKDFKTKVENIFTNVNCILVGENKGYAIANNIGLKSVKTKYALVLNPDTILDKDAIKNFFTTKEQVKDFWLIGPANNQIVNFNDKDSNLKEVDNLKGFAIFLNLSKFNQNYFDENFFLFFEEIDLCRRVKKNKGKIYLDKNIFVKHDGASSVNKINKLDLEKTRNWHWMWSTFYYHKKHKGFLLALLIVIPKIITATLKLILSFITSNKKQREIYLSRLSGLINSIAGKESWFRPRLD